jgi:hypothetical protein
VHFIVRIAMRLFLALALLPLLIAGCTPYIPVKDDFGTSALAPPTDSRGAVPPEFAEFNVYDPAVNRLVANQICTTPYQLLEEKTLDASSGRLVVARGRCPTHIPFFGP